jgi:hypothetical protein
VFKPPGRPGERGPSGAGTFGSLKLITVLDGEPGKIGLSGVNNKIKQKTSVQIFQIQNYERLFYNLNK